MTRYLPAVARKKGSVSGLARYASNPIINYGGGGWKDFMVHTPLVFTDPTDATKLIMVYGGVDNGMPQRVTVGLATALASNPYHWTECAGNPFILDAWCSGLAVVGTDVYLYSGGGGGASGTDIDLYKSTNLTAAHAIAGTATFAQTAGVLTKSGDETLIYYPTIIRADSTHWYMAYTYDTMLAHVPGIRMATSSDGLSWTSNPANLISTGTAGQFDATYLEGGLLKEIDGIYTLTYNAYNHPLVPSTQADSMYCIGMAGSPVVNTNYGKSTMNPVFPGSLKAGTPDQFHVATPWWFQLGGRWYLFYQAADVDPATTVFTADSFTMCIATGSPGFSPVSKFLSDIGTPATLYTLSGPATGESGSASSNFTAQIQLGRAVSGTVTVTPNDGAAGGTFTPTTVSLTTAVPAATFTYTPSSTGNKAISVTNNGGLTNPGSITYDSVPSGLVDGDTVTSWLDNSTAANHAIGTGAPIFKTNILNSKPVVRMSTANLSGFSLTNPITVAGAWCIYAVMKLPSAGAIASLVGNASPGLPLGAYVTPTVIYAANAGGYGSYSATAGAFHVYTADNRTPGVAFGTSSQLNIDGTLTTGTPISSVNSGLFTYLGYNGFGTPAYSDGDIAEILIAQGLADTTVRANVEATLGAKYGITVSSGGTTIDLSTVPGLVGWWKADSLL